MCGVLFGPVLFICVFCADEPFLPWTVCRVRVLFFALFRWGFVRVKFGPVVKFCGSSVIAKTRLRPFVRKISVTNVEFVSSLRTQINDCVFIGSTAYVVNASVISAGCFRLDMDLDFCAIWASPGMFFSVAT